MLSNNTAHKFNDKKSKKNLQTLEENKEEYDLTAAGRAEIRSAHSSISNNEVGKKISPRLIDLKDFPELKASGKQSNKFCVPRNSNSRGLIINKPWLSVVTSGNKKNKYVGFPPIAIPGNFISSEAGLSTIKNDQASRLSESNSDSTTINYEHANTNSKQKKDRSKKVPVQPPRNPMKKKRSDPVFVNFQDFFAMNKVKKRDRQLMSTNRSHMFRRKELLSGNFLDSSNPIRSRGKHREIRKKKLSNLKLTIIKERIIKSKLRENNSNSESRSKNLLDMIDFNSEIKIYLNELNNRKSKNSGIKKNNQIKNDSTEKKKNEDIKSEKKENLQSVHKEKIIPQLSAEGEIRFTSKFREYCDNVITPDLNTAVAKLIEELIKLQDRIFLRDPIKAKARKRHVSGLREVKKYLGLKKVKMVIIAPNLEKLQMEGSVYDSINELKSLAVSLSVPYGFALDRYKLGKCTKKNVPVSAFAVMSYEGLEALYDEALQHLLEAKRKFSELLKPKVEADIEDINSKVLSSLVNAFQEVLEVSKNTASTVD